MDNCFIPFVRPEPRMPGMVRSLLRKPFAPTVLCLLCGLAAGFWLRELAAPSFGQPGHRSRLQPGAKLMPDSPAAYDPDGERPYPQYQPAGKVLQPCPDFKPGDIPPQDLSIFGGAGKTSQSSVDDVRNFDEFCKGCGDRKAKVME